MKNFDTTSIKKILVPIDFSENSINALDYAIEVSKSIKASITVFHAYNVPVTGPNEPPIIAEQVLLDMHHMSEQKLASVCADLKKHHALEIKHKSSYGYPVKAITSYCEHKKFDMIIMGKQGAGALLGNFVGTTTTSIIENSICPVLTVPQSYQFSGIKSIVFASDLINTDINSIEQLINIAKAFGSHIDIVHIYNDDDSKLVKEAMMSAFIKKIKCAEGYYELSSVLIYGHDVADLLTDYLEINDVDLLVMSNRKRGFFDKIFERSTTKKLSYRMKVPLLAFHFREKIE